MIAIVEPGNLTSVVKALQHLGRECVVSQRLTLWDAPTKLDHSRRWELQGDGSRLANGDLGAALREAYRRRRPLLGICLGLQWLFEGSDRGSRSCLVLASFVGTLHAILRSREVPTCGMGQHRGRVGFAVAAEAFRREHIFTSLTPTARLVCDDTVATCTIRRTIHGGGRARTLCSVCNFIRRNQAPLGMHDSGELLCTVKRLPSALLPAST